jgi:hypothetical protein
MQKARSYLKNNLKAKRTGYGGGSSGSMLAYQAQGPEMKSQYCQKAKREGGEIKIVYQRKC